MEYFYKPDLWRLTERQLPIRSGAAAQTRFSLGNGYLGVRGSFEEEAGPSAYGGYAGTYLNGFYETSDIHYGEAAYGYPKSSQAMINIINGKTIRVWIGKEPLDLSTGTIRKYVRTLDFHDGILSREVN